MHFPYEASDIDAVVFDIGGVFTVRDPHFMRTGMGNAGLVISASDDHFVRAHYEGVAALAASLDPDIESHVDEYDPAFWRHYENAYFATLGIDGDRIEDAIAAMKVEVHEKLPHPIWRHLLQVNIDGFHRLIAHQIPVAIVSNNDGTAERQMVEFGICQVGPGPLPSVVVVIDSGVIGVAKPNPTIFKPALEALATAPARTLYVGDTVHADVNGARNAGMAVVQLDPFDLHAHFEHARVPNVTVLADLLLAGT